MLMTRCGWATRRESRSARAARDCAARHFPAGQVAHVESHSHASSPLHSRRRPSGCLQPRDALPEPPMPSSPTPRTREPSGPADAARLTAHTELYRHAIVLPVIDMLHVVQRQQLQLEKIQQLHASWQPLAHTGVFHDDPIPPMSPTPTPTASSSLTPEPSVSSADVHPTASLTPPSTSHGTTAAAPPPSKRPPSKCPPPSQPRPRSLRHNARSDRRATRGYGSIASGRVTRSQRRWDTEFIELDASKRAVRCDGPVPRSRQPG